MLHPNDIVTIIDFGNIRRIFGLKQVT